MTQLIIEIILKYNIVNKIDYFVLNNTSFNNTCVEIVLHRLHLNLNSIHCCLHCLEHVLNLKAKAFLFDQKMETFEIEITFH